MNARARTRRAAPAGETARAETDGSLAVRERLMMLLISPHVTEKATQAQQQHNQYAFRIRRDATRGDVRRAVELMFDVKVQSVQIVNLPGKQRRVRGRAGQSGTGRTQDWKKAYVRLAAGVSIDYEAQGAKR